MVLRLTKVATHVILSFVKYVKIKTENALCKMSLMKILPVEKHKS